MQVSRLEAEREAAEEPEEVPEPAAPEDSPISDEVISFSRFD